MAPDGPDREPVAASIAALAERIGRPAFTAVCVDLLAGAPRERYVVELRALTGHGWQPGDAVLDRDRWRDHWVRTWGARGLLHVWDDAATPAVVRGLADQHHRPAEMCLKVGARHDVAGTGPGAAALAAHPLPRVRVQAVRCLAVTGDTEHVAALAARLDDEHPDVRRQAARALETLRRRLDLDA
ncbi:HEAT repeat domain-containing protein [Nocardioides dongxiaopingii]|uniref:HEAT repeat domain-containing protein n=1 Tax=Nocardioides sp. S-1144 TaxID=2582905 RepID=UPI00110DEDFC|nr:HEAT repeat domain-containing protein [Nocardioides sp. S-1144]QCW50193.1 HEAT repeat domain-containing protein [Nocardioides sp. S-1144]